MKTKSIIKSLLLAAVLAAGLPALAQQQAPIELAGASKANYRGEYKQGEVIVKFKDDAGVTVKVAKHGKRLMTTSVTSLDSKLQAIGLNTAEQLMPLTGAKKLSLNKAPRRGPSGKIVPEPDLSRLYLMTFEETPEKPMKDVVEQLKQIDQVEYVYPNYYVYAQSDGEAYEAEPMRSQQWYLDAIKLPQLWQMPKLEGAKRPVIAIIDTGVDITHPDLAANIWTNAAEASGAEAEDDDQNGFADDVHGWNFVQHNATMEDRNGHGTHCAGIAAAVGNNGIGIAGANPDAIIMPVTVMEPDGVGTASVIIQGIDYAVANGADVLSMSFGSDKPWGYQVFQKAYQTAILAGAAGNAGCSIYFRQSIAGSGISFPGAFDIVLGVQASNEQNTQAGFSNFDPDGPYYVNSDWFGSEWWNYEIWAPGHNILSTYPGGTYRTMNGTSMATPLVAGAVSRLLQTKEPEYYRDVWIGDIVAAKAQDSIIVMDDYRSGTEYATSIFDAMAAYNFDYSNRKARLSIPLVEIDDTEGGDGDGIIDAGETIKLWPTLRSEWGLANNVTFSVMANPLYESASNVEVLENNVDFGYSLNRASLRSKNPLVIKVADDVDDSHILKLRVTATCDNIINDVEQDVEFKVENSVEVSGVINEDMTLYPDKHYVVKKSIAIPQGVTLTIMPGTRLEFNEDCYIKSEGKLIANGKPDSLIVFTSRENQYPWGAIASSNRDTLVYCNLDNFYFVRLPNIYLKDCVVKKIRNFSVFQFIYGYRNNVLDCIEWQGLNDSNHNNDLSFSNYVNSYANSPDHNWRYSQLSSCNLLNIGYSKYEFIGGNDGITTDHAEFPSWLGTSKEEIIRPFIYDSQNPNVDCFTTVDLSNMPARPIYDTHGIVWKVVVDGYDAQDEFAEMPPLGVGRHKFEVYYNRDDMDTTYTPTITMGTYEPYNQIPISDGGYWSVKDSASVYTAFLTVNGKLSADGLNRIKVTGGKDYDHFDIPDEYTRFKVLVQAAGSMATGFAAEAGLGKVKLTWNNENNDFEDAMGFNVYRYGEPKPKAVYNPHWDDQGNYLEYDTIMVADTIRLNEMILDLDTDHFTDYEVTPGVTYYYYYKVLSTDLKEYDISNVVAATPLTSTLGDANASGSVDVADVITTVNYAAGMDPKPFIFGAADVNVDEEIDILDVIGIIKIITHPNSAATASVEAVAEYSVEDGIVYVDCPVDLAGVQLMLNADREATITATEALNGFEQVGAWMDETSYLFMAYNMAGRVIPAGRHAILNIADADITDIRLSDKDGHNVLAVPAVPTVIDHIAADQHVRRGVYDLMGRKVANDASSLPRLQPGIYIVNGNKVVVK